MFEIIDSATGNVIGTVGSLLAAMRRADALQFSTLRPHHLREARNDAASSIGTIVWIDDIPVVR